MKTHFEPTTFEHLCVCVSSGCLQSVNVVIYREGSKRRESRLFDEFSRLLSCLPVIMSVAIRSHWKRECSSWQAGGFDVYTNQWCAIVIQHVSEPTHNRGSILDVIISAVDHGARSVCVSDPGISNYKLLLWSINGGSNDLPKYFTVNRRLWRQFHTDDFRSALSSSCLCDQLFINEQCDVDELFHNKIIELLDVHAPFRGLRNCLSKLGMVRNGMLKILWKRFGV